MTRLNLISPIISLFIFFFLTTMNYQFSYARTLTNSSPTPIPTHHQTHHQNQPNFKFLMQNVLNMTQKYTKPNPKTTQTQIPFPKPIGYFPPKNGIPLPPSFDHHFSSNYNYNNNLGSIMSFLPKAAPQELEIGSVTQIDEHLFETTTTTTSSTSSYGSLIVGKAQGMFVGSTSENNNNNNSHNMVAFTVSFFNDINIIKDGLRLFGVYRKGISEESHIAVIGGIGKYEGANGYAVLKPIDHVDKVETKKLLLFNVYLS